MSALPQIRLPAGVKVLACRIFAPELAYLGLTEPTVKYLEPALHARIPELQANVAQALADMEQDPDTHTIIVLYGYCGGGLEGLASQRVNLILPKAHDCIPLLMGRYRCQESTTHTYFLSPGILDSQVTPLHELEKTAQRLGRERALMAHKLMLDAYREIVLLQTGSEIKPEHREQGRQMAELFDLVYKEEKGDIAWLAGLLQRQEQRMVSLKPGEKICMAMFIEPD